MKQKISSFFRDYWKKFVLVGLLGLACVLFDRMEFPRIEVFVRDALQYLNSTENIDKSLVTVNIDTPSVYATRPLNFEMLKNLLEKLREGRPKKIILVISPQEIDSSQNKNDLNDMDYFNYFLSIPNLYLFSLTTSEARKRFDSEVNYKNFPRQFQIGISSDFKHGAMDRKNRRGMISYDKTGLDDNFINLKKYGFQTKSADFYNYPYRLWDTTQVYTKSFPLGTMGNYKISDIIEGRTSLSYIKDKNVFLGTFDEFSLLANPSIFNLLGKQDEGTFAAYYYPPADLVANYINFYTTGDYIKFVNLVNDIGILFFILAFLILIDLGVRIKLYIFLSFIPSILLFQVFIYKINSFYIDFSRSYIFLFIAQYLVLPIMMLSLFKSQEKKRLKEVSDARIDSLLTISERVAHDIRSPLSAINLIISKVNFPNPEYKDIINSALNRIDETADKILTKYKSNLHPNIEIFEPINLSVLINSLVAEKKIINSNITYTLVNFDSGVKEVLGHKLELERVISNILDNSIYALSSNKKGPEIVVELVYERNYAFIKIKDNGIGVQGGILNLLGKERITTKITDKGSGIGLLHANRAIERMNGTFEINSVEAQQTTITIMLKTVN